MTEDVSSSKSTCSGKLTASDATSVMSHQRGGSVISPGLFVPSLQFVKTELVLRERNPFCLSYSFNHNVRAVRCTNLEFVTLSKPYVANGYLIIGGARDGPTGLKP